MIAPNNNAGHFFDGSPHDRFTKLMMSMLPAVEPWVVPGENVMNPGGVENVNPLDTLSSEYHPWGVRVRLSLLPSPLPSPHCTQCHDGRPATGAAGM